MLAGAPRPAAPPGPAPGQLGAPGVVVPTQLGAPGVALPTQLGGMVAGTPSAKLTELTRTNPSLVSYAVKVFGTTDLTEAQWRQCEDQLKVSQLD